MPCHCGAQTLTRALVRQLWGVRGHTQVSVLLLLAFTCGVGPQQAAATLGVPAFCGSCARQQGWGAGAARLLGGLCMHRTWECSVLTA